jgi:hypothetical protein
MTTEFLDKFLSGEIENKDEKQIAQERKEKRNQSLVADSDDQDDILTTEELVSEEVVDEVVETTDTAKPEEADTDVSDELEEEVSESEETDEVTSDEEDFVVELDGKEITFSEIRELQKGSMRQADYTKKTQEVSELRKKVEADEAKFNSLLSDLEEKSATLEVMIKEQNEDIDFDYLKEYDPSEYLIQKEKIEKREKTLEELKSTKSSINEENTKKLQNEESTKLFTVIPEWVNEDGKTSDVFASDIIMMNDYLTKKIGMSNEEIGKIVLHKDWLIIRDAAKNSSIVDKKAVMNKKLKKAPVVTKSHSKTSTQSVMNKEIQQAEERFKQSGKDSDYVSLQKIRRKFAK